MTKTADRPDPDVPGLRGRVVTANRWPDRGFGNYRTQAARLAGIFFTAIWLVYLIGPVVDLFTRHYSEVDRWTGLAIIVAFCAIYVTLVPNWPSEPRYTLPGLAGLVVLAAVECTLFGGIGSASLWIFVSSASGLLIRNARWAARTCLAVTACYIVFCFTGHVDSGDFLGNLLPVAFLGFAMMGLRRQIELTNQLQQAREEVAQLAANEERLRLARDMHDLTGQSLSTITLKSELAGRLLGRLPEGPDRDRVASEVEQVAAVSRQTLRDIREAISGYRRPTLAVEIITARAALSSAGIAAHDDADLTLLSGTFDPDAEAALAWCLREAVTNVVRHSGADNCYLRMGRQGQALSLTVRDDGAGHAARPDEPGRPHGPGSGLTGMSERLSAVGGALELQPDLNPGFCLTATVPEVPEVQARAHRVTVTG
jgi:two-component system, NarL family, sensor histidine kinase DesK